MTKRIMFLAIAAAFAVSAFALSDEYAQFGKGPAQFLMTKDEQSQWRAVKTDDEAKKFIDDFWARRGAQAKAEFDAKVKYADEHFAEPHKKGSMSDRGHVLIVLGGPAKRTQSQPQMNTPPRIDPNAANEDQAADQPRARQVWEYEQGKTPGLPMPVLDVAFVDTLNNGEWKLERTHASGDYNQVFDKFNEATVAAHGNAPAQTAATTTTTTTTETTKTTTTGPAAAVPPAQLKNAAYQKAVDDLKAGKSGINKNIFTTYTQLVSPTGEFYVPVELFIPKSSSLTPDSADTFFGVVEDAGGKAVYAFEEPAKLATSKDEQFVDKTLDLPTGKYTAYLGLAKGDAPVVITSKPLDITTVAKDATGTSQLILSNNIFETEKAAPVKSAYAFGRLKVVPKANFTFTTADELTYFVELHNPGIDPATSLPKLQVKLELSGGKLAKPIPRPLSDVTALPLSGAPGPGEYAIIDSIQLEGIKSVLTPGDYLLKVKIVDTVSKQTYNLEQSFKIAG